jgi:excisionase family DNA binding protein
MASSEVQYGVRDVARLLGLSLTRAGALCREGKVPAIRDGGRWRIPTGAWREWCARRERAALARVEGANEARERAVGG